MPKYEIEIDLPSDVLAKWKPVAIRYAKDGDTVAWLDGETMFVDSDNTWLNRNWAFLILEPVKQYRTPSLPEDEGKLSEFSNDGFKTVVTGRLFAYAGETPEMGRAWASSDYLDLEFSECRIEVTE